MAGKFGNGGLVLNQAGEITADRNGLWSGACQFSFPQGRLDLVPGVGTQHPYANFLVAERFRLVFSPGLWRLSVEYVGANVNSTEPQYELSPGTGNEPIETHKDFEETLAGKPSAPLNKAVFRDEVTGFETEDDALGIFSHFKAGSDLAGLAQYITQNNTVWTKTWTQRAKPATGKVKISSPEGPSPSYGGSMNWLEMPVAYTLRGNVYSCSQRWVASGPKGWNPLVYPG